MPLDERGVSKRCNGPAPRSIVLVECTSAGAVPVIKRRPLSSWDTPPTMSAFDNIDYARFDVCAAVVMEGVAVIESAHRDACHAWLRQRDYSMSSIDFAQGIGSAVVALGELFRWEEQFGYSLSHDKRNLNALRDGFGFDLKPGQGHVLELLNTEFAHREDPHWFSGLLEIVHEHFLCQLALGARFFAMLVLDRGSPLIGVSYGTLRVPLPFTTAAKHRDPFAAGRPSSEPNDWAKGGTPPS